MKHLRILILALVGVVAMAGVTTGLAADSESMTIEGTSNASTPTQARQAALKDAFDKAALVEITNLIGPAKLEKNRPLLNAKILSQSSKYIVNYKTGEMKVDKNGQSTLAVTLKLNAKSLRDLLAKEGLLYQSEGPANIFPIIQITEKRPNGRSFRWWMEEANAQNIFLRDILKNALKQLDGLFRPKSFYLIDPVNQHYVQMVPDAYRNPNLTLDDILFLGQYFKAQIVVHGEAGFEPSATKARTIQMDLRLTAYHAANGRVVAEVNRVYESQPGEWDPAELQVASKGFEDASQDLVSQVFEQ